MSPMEQELPTLPEHPRSPPCYWGTIWLFWEEYDVTNGVIRIRKWKKDIQPYCQMEKQWSTKHFTENQRSSNTRSVVLHVCFVDGCLSFCPFSFCHCVVCSSSIYGFWLTPNQKRTYNPIVKWKNNDLQSTSQKTKDRVIRTVFIISP
jgi:hypothetical protein